jgi:hypothetical protein
MFGCKNSQAFGRISVRVNNRVARWFVFKPKIQIWVNFGGSCNGRCWYILWTLSPFYSLLLYFMDIWKFGIFFQVLVFCTKKNLSTLVNNVIKTTKLLVGSVSAMFWSRINIGQIIDNDEFRYCWS